jgi:hypothetical protein
MALKKNANLNGRYLVFAWVNAAGGMRDCVGGFDAVEWAETALERLNPQPYRWQIFDTQTRTVVDGVNLDTSNEE